MPSSRESSQPRSPVLQADSLLSEPPGKPHLNIQEEEKSHVLVYQTHNVNNIGHQDIGK